jgi:membrane-bound lytic murein transglycosylase A
MVNALRAAIAAAISRLLPAAITGPLAAAILGALTACSNPPPAATPEAPPFDASNPMNIPMVNATIVRPRARWVSTPWAELSGWEADRASELWPALLRGCEKPAPEWAALCAQALAATNVQSDAAVRAWLKRHLQPYRVEALDGAPDGLITGYFEPLVQATRTARGAYQVPLYGPPADLATRKPYWTRQQIDTHAAAKASLRGRAIAYVADPLDALILQIQGSGRLALTEANGSRKLVRVAFAGHNDHAYQSVGRWLIDQGELTATQASWPAIKAWARLNPKRLNEMLWANPRVVFFREEPLPDPQLGPKGAQGAPLTPGRSVAVDALAIPYGAPVWLDTTEPLSSAPLRRLAMAQDTGTAITGAVRADYFWGWGETAEAQAGRMKQPLRMWVLWPKAR